MFLTLNCERINNNSTKYSKMKFSFITNQKLINTSQIYEISVEVLEKNAKAIGEKKFYNLPNNELLTNWIIRPKTNKFDVVPLKNAVVPATADPSAP